MSNRFVSGGTIGTASDDATSTSQPAATSGTGGSKNVEWERAQAQLEAERKQREDARIKAAQGDEPSLYDVLQANKAAKQAAFEEANKLTNQFRALDDDEIEFLDEVAQRQKREEESLRKEMEDGLRMFREARKGETGGSNGGEAKKDGIEGGDGKDEEWAVGARKRKRGHNEKGGLVRRKVEKKKEEDEDAMRTDEKEGDDDEKKKKKKEVEKVEVQKEKPKASLGLVGYGSDSDDDDDEDEEDDE